MKKPDVKPPDDAKPPRSLNQALTENKRVKDIVTESADELASLNAILHEGIASQQRLAEVEIALQKSEAIEIKVQDASEKLSGVNEVLEHEINARHRLENALTTVTDEKDEALRAALHDALTGLPNRVLFLDRLEYGIEVAKRQRWSLAVMFLDLNGFKAINDNYGHDTGDAVLRVVAQRLEANKRRDDTVSRHGGDEFLYLLMEMKDDQVAARFAEKIIKAVQLPCETSAGALTVNTSIGIAIFPTDGTTADDLIKRADAAMYHAKRLKCGYAFASDDTRP